ncbi:uncharacterized protein LOC114580974, partial [Dendrobium catenatum]|uniref:uncharacterized protein LOC114580974 n=1 Tax=Dendrobium catenatum TaxID=906689 RepID=UPI00109F7E0B
DTCPREEAEILVEARETAQRRLEGGETGTSDSALECGTESFGVGRASARRDRKRRGVGLEFREHREAGVVELASGSVELPSDRAGGSGSAGVVRTGEIRLAGVGVGYLTQGEGSVSGGVGLPWTCELGGFCEQRRSRGREVGVGYLTQGEGSVSGGVGLPWTCELGGFCEQRRSRGREV